MTLSLQVSGNIHSGGAGLQQIADDFMSIVLDDPELLNAEFYAIVGFPEPPAHANPSRQLQPGSAPLAAGRNPTRRLASDNGAHGNEWLRGRSPPR